MSEFKIINDYISRAKTDASVVLGIGDDAAVLNMPLGYQMVQTLDTMVAGVHFDQHFSADALAHKLLHVNVSDVAAMGATPKWATVALTLPAVDESWLDEFSAGLQSRATALGINLVGGDTTSGPLTVSMNLTGLVKEGEYLSRSKAQASDDIYVSGYLGDAALALSKAGAQQHALIKRLQYPEARLNLGTHLYGLATACLDLSDGLLGDLGHICRASGLAAEVWVDQLPLSSAYIEFFKQQAIDVNPDYALNGGDDYELCFTAKPEHREAIAQLSASLDLPITRLGQMKAIPLTEKNSTTEPVHCINAGQAYQCQRLSWQHFETQT